MKMDRIYTNQNFLHCVSSFEGTSYKSLSWVQSLDLLFLAALFLLVFTSADIIFHKFSELHSTLSEKKIFVSNFPFLTDSLNPHPQPPTL